MRQTKLPELNHQIRRYCPRAFYSQTMEQAVSDNKAHTKKTSVADLPEPPRRPTTLS
jgi:hypothetical protein